MCVHMGECLCVRCAHAWVPFRPLSLPPLFLLFFPSFSPPCSAAFWGPLPNSGGTWDTSLLVPRAQVEVGRQLVQREGKGGLYL